MAWSRSIGTILLILSAVAASGCLMYRGDSSPGLVTEGYNPTVALAPRMDVVLHHRHTMDGDDVSGRFTDLTYKEINKSFERVKRKTPFLANAGRGTIKADFLLDLDTEVAEHGKDSAFITGLSLFLIPGFCTSDVIVEGKLKTLDGETVSEHRASSQLKMIIHLGFLPLLPALPFIAPGDELYDEPFQDVFIQMEQDLEKRLAED